MSSSSDKLASTRLQLLVPVYNEGENVARLHENLLAEKIDFDSLSFVYDFDEDTTLPVIERLQAKDPRLLAKKNTYGRGALNALRWGFAHTQPGPVVVLMADNSDKLSIIPEMLALWKDGATIVSPSRYMKGGKQHGGGLVKSGLSRIAGISLKLLGFPTADATNNYKLYDGEWLQAQTIESTGGFEVAIELCAKAFAQDRKIVELPTEWYDRELGESRFKMVEWIPRYLRWYFICLGSLLRNMFRRPASRQARPR